MSETRKEVPLQLARSKPIKPRILPTQTRRNAETHQILVRHYESHETDEERPYSIVSSTIGQDENKQPNAVEHAKYIGSSRNRNGQQNQAYFKAKFIESKIDEVLDELNETCIYRRAVYVGEDCSFEYRRCILDWTVQSLSQIDDRSEHDDHNQQNVLLFNQTMNCMEWFI